MNQQRTDGWHQDRCGKITGSRFADVLAISKRDGNPLKAREDLIWTLVSERIDNYQVDGALSVAMRWGIDNEFEALSQYQIHTGEIVEQVGFIQHPKYDFIGASPDGLIGNDAGIEIKCPKSPEIHKKRWLSNFAPDEYIAQIQGCMWVTGRSKWDFISYDPDTIAELRILIITVLRDDEFIEKLENECLKLNDEVNNIVLKLLKNAI